MSPFELIFPPAWLFAFFGCRRAKRELPSAAQALGLTFRETDNTDQIGEISGTIRAHEISVPADHGAMILVEYRGGARIDGLDLSTWVPSNLRRKTSFDSGVPAFDRAFRKRLATASQAEKLAQHRALFENIAAFRRAWRWQVVQISFSEVQLAIVVQERGLGVRYVSAEQLRQIVPAAVDLVEQLEHALSL